MKRKIYSLGLILIFLSHVTLINAQTGVSFFIQSDSLLPNSKVIDIVETDNNNLILLNTCSDSKYRNHSINTITTEASGKLLSEKTLEVNNVYDLISIEEKTENRYTVFGNTTLNKTFEPFELTIKNSCEIISKQQLPQVYSTQISDVISNKNYYMVLYTKIGKNNLYNISLNKVNSETGQIEWFKKISSENNEEANQIIIDENENFYILGKKYNDKITEFIPIIYKIDKNGTQLWKMALDVPTNLNKHSFTTYKNSTIIYTCGYTKSGTGFSETRIIKLNDSGEELNNERISEFSVNGIINIVDNNLLLYGSKFMVDKQQTITKGKYVIIDSNLTQISDKVLDKNDKPDINLNSKAQTSSEFLCAQKISNNRIALGGKVFMPTTNNKYNVPLLMIINSDGSYKK